MHADVFGKEKSYAIRNDKNIRIIIASQEIYIQ
jgi:hypothetical protein